MRKLLMCCVAFIFFLSCVDLDYSKKVDTSEFHKRELVVKVGDQLITGAGVVKRKTRYKISAHFKEKMKRVTIANPHREVVFRNISKLEYDFYPSFLLENDGSNVMQISALSAKGVSHDAIIDFTAGEDLDGDVYCNGAALNGVASICQARKGTIQKIWFKSKVKAYSEKSCASPLSADGKKTLDEDVAYSYTVKVSLGFCVYLFVDLKTNKKHRLTTFGYDKLRVGYDF